MKGFIFLTGVPGVGKTTVINEAIKLNNALKSVNYGEKILKESKTVEASRDLLKRESISKQLDLSISVAKTIADEYEGLTIIDTQAFIKTPFGYLPGIYEQIIDLLSPIAFISLEASADNIYSNRKKDNSRVYDMENKDSITLHQELNRSALGNAAMTSKCIFSIISNNDSPETAGKKLHTLIENL